MIPIRSHAYCGGRCASLTSSSSFSAFPMAFTFNLRCLSSFLRHSPEGDSFLKRQVKPSYMSTFSPTSQKPIAPTACSPAKGEGGNDNGGEAGVLSFTGEIPIDAVEFNALLPLGGHPARLERAKASLSVDPTSAAAAAEGTSSNEDAGLDSGGDVTVRDYENIISGDTASAESVLLKCSTMMQEVLTAPVGTVINARNRLCRWRCQHAGCGEINSLQLGVCRRCRRERFSVCVACEQCGYRGNVISNATAYFNGNTTGAAAAAADASRDDSNNNNSKYASSPLSYPSVDDSGVVRNYTPCRGLVEFGRENCYPPFLHSQRCRRCRHLLHGSTIVSVVTAPANTHTNSSTNGNSDGSGSRSKDDTTMVVQPAQFGTWLCACGLQNASNRLSCHRCRMPRIIVPSSLPLMAPQLLTGRGDDRHGGRGPGKAAKEGVDFSQYFIAEGHYDFQNCTQWVCDSCECVNQASFQRVVAPYYPSDVDRTRQGGSTGDRGQQEDEQRQQGQSGGDEGEEKEEEEAEAARRRERTRRNSRRCRGDICCRRCHTSWHFQIISGSNNNNNTNNNGNDSNSSSNSNSSSFYWRCACHAVHPSSVQTCPVCGLPGVPNMPAVAISIWAMGDWRCAACGTHNYRDRQVCICGAGRPKLNSS